MIPQGAQAKPLEPLETLILIKPEEFWAHALLSVSLRTERPWPWRRACPNATSMLG